MNTWKSIEKDTTVERKGTHGIPKLLHTALGLYYTVQMCQNPPTLLIHPIPIWLSYLHRNVQHNTR